VLRDLDKKDASSAGRGRRSLLRLMVEGSRALEGFLHEGLREAGYGDVRPAHYAVFRYMKDEGSRVTELAEAAGMTKQSMGELVAYLEERAYVERRPDPRDRRAKIVVSTEKGQQGIEAAAERIAEIEAELAGRMGKERLEELISSLAELTAILGEPEGIRMGPAHEIP
jgi:MarR family transcriptional regulator, temperature-dependent positive regulator of motility